MAWRSSGTTNNELIDNLKRFGVISSEALENGFRNVDRKYFVPKGSEQMAHSDQPLKEGRVHISAPHIYGSALQALDLRPDCCHAFLNVGSGTGYVSSIVAHVLGPHSTNVGVEIYKEVVTHSLEAIAAWKAELQGEGRARVPAISIYHGNALEIDPSQGEGSIGFDRIYVGASVEKAQLYRLTRLLKPGGVLVGPVDDELMKVTRIGNNKNCNDRKEFSHQLLSGVRFASLLSRPSMPLAIPSPVWEPSIHHLYPPSFRDSTMEIMLCCNAHIVQPVPAARQVNLAAMLPRHLWMEILSYTTRDWFESSHTDAEYLQQRLREEQIAAQKERDARAELEARLQSAERERDVYRLLARRWQSRLNALIQRQKRAIGSNNNKVVTLPQQQQQQQQQRHSQQHLDEEDHDDEDDDGEILLSGRDLVGLSDMFLRGIDDASDSEDDDDDEESHNGQQERAHLEDHDMDDAQEESESLDDEDDDDDPDPGEAGNAHAGQDDDDDDEDASWGDAGGHSSFMDDSETTPAIATGSVASLAATAAASHALLLRPQTRTVSMTSEDL